MKLRASHVGWRIFASGFAMFLLFVSNAAAQNSLRPEVLKVEPPSWWAGHSLNPVRLLVRGRNLHGAHVSATRPEIECSGTLVNPAGTYLFVNVHIAPATRPGNYPLTIETNGGTTTLPFSLNAPFDASKNFQGITTDDVIYLIMPDRFSDGDAQNNAPANSPREANTRANPRAYHGGDFRGIINHLSYLKNLGVTAIWLTPWYDNWNGVHLCDKPWCPNTSYHGYGAIDYYAVEDHFGDMGSLREMIERAHALGLKVIQDQVANHVGVRHFWIEDPPLDNWFHGTLHSHTANPFRGDQLLSPHTPPHQRAETLDGWFSDDLPDMNQDEPEVARYEIQNALWWVGMTGIDGIRQDTIQYMPRRFIRDLSASLHRQYPKFWMVGEVFDRDPMHTSFFIGGRKGWDGIDTELDSVFDFPAWQISLDVFNGKIPAQALRYILRSDSLYTDASRLTVMANNHDTKRFMSLDGATLEGAMLHVAYILTIRGTPQLYYGEELALEGGEDPDNRRDFPGGFPNDARNAFETSGRTAAQERMYQWTRDWLALRRAHPAIRRGELIDLAFDDDGYAYARRDADETIVIAINRAATAKTLVIPTAALEGGDATTLVPLLNAKERVNASARTIALPVPARMAVAYKVLSP